MSYPKPDEAEQRAAAATAPAKPEGDIDIRVTDPVKCGKWLDGLPLEMRLRELERFSSDDDRTKIIEALPVDVRMRWINEEREHLEGIAADQPVEGADFGEDPQEQVKVPGSDVSKVYDRAPDVGAELVKQLVEERIAAEKRANVAESHLSRYRAKYGELA
jgi:hypothetical protein